MVGSFQLSFFKSPIFFVFSHLFLVFSLYFLFFVFSFFFLLYLFFHFTSFISSLSFYFLPQLSLSLSPGLQPDKWAFSPDYSFQHTKTGLPRFLSSHLIPLSPWAHCRTLSDCTWDNLVDCGMSCLPLFVQFFKRREVVLQNARISRLSSIALKINEKTKGGHLHSQRGSVGGNCLSSLR